MIIKMTGGRGARLIREKNRVKELKIGLEHAVVVMRSAPECVLRTNCALSDAVFPL